MNILIVGLGSIAIKHLDAINKLQISTNIFALRSNPDSEVHTSITNIYDLETCDIDFSFAIISNPTYLHFQFIELLIKKGVNLFIEKPPVGSLDNFEILLKLAEESRLINYVACNLRFHPCLQYLKNKLKFCKKRINEVNIYCGSYLPEWRPNKDFREIYSSKPEMGGGVHLDLYHEIDFTTWLFGIPLKSTSTLRNVSSLKIDAYDYANFILQYELFTASIVLNYYRRDPKRFLEIIFDDDTWSVDLINNNIINKEGCIIYENSEFLLIDTYYYQMKYFMEIMDTRNKPMNSLVESYEVLKIVLSNV